MANAEDRKSNNSMMKALIAVVALFLLLVGAIAAALMFTGGKPTRTGPIPSLGDPVAGRQVALRPDINCVFCHSDDGSIVQGPSFKGMYGSVMKYEDGSSLLIDEAAIRYALKHPIEKVAEGFEPRMPEFDSKLSETDKVNLIAYLQSIGAGK